MRVCLHFWMAALALQADCFSRDKGSHQWWGQLCRSTPQVQKGVMMRVFFGSSTLLVQPASLCVRERGREREGGREGEKTLQKRTIFEEMRSEHKKWKMAVKVPVPVQKGPQSQWHQGELLMICFFNRFLCLVWMTTDCNDLMVFHQAVGNHLMMSQQPGAINFQQTSIVCHHMCLMNHDWNVLTQSGVKWPGWCDVITSNQTGVIEHLASQFSKNNRNAKNQKLHQPQQWCFQPHITDQSITHTKKNVFFWKNNSFIIITIVSIFQISNEKPSRSLTTL